MFYRGLFKAGINLPWKKLEDAQHVSGAGRIAESAKMGSRAERRNGHVIMVSLTYLAVCARLVLPEMLHESRSFFSNRKLYTVNLHGLKLL